MAEVSGNEKMTPFSSSKLLRGILIWDLFLPKHYTNISSDLYLSYFSPSLKAPGPLPLFLCISVWHTMCKHMPLSVAPWLTHRFYPKVIQAVSLFPTAVLQRDTDTCKLHCILKLCPGTEDLEQRRSRTHGVSMEVCPGQAHGACIQ